MRSLIEFACMGEALLGTLDEAKGTTGLLIVSGGNDIRSGAHRGMALLAQRIAEAGYPVFRYDRRGIGDSTGENNGFETGAADLAAAADAFRRSARQIERVIGFGNCDAATTLALFGPQARLDGLVLANPWVIEDTDDLPPAAAIRSYYAERLRDPKEWLRLVRGGVNIGKLVSGLTKIASKPAEQPASLAHRVAEALPRVPARVLLAKGDNTAIAFRDAWKSPFFDAARVRVKVEERDSDSHSFASAEDKQWLYERVLAALN